MGELFVRTALKVKQALPQARFLVPFATRESKVLFEDALARVQPGELDLTLMIGHSLEAMAASDVVLAASGTATLEAALLKRPMVITYRLNPLSWWLVRRRIYVSHAGMPNILAGERIVPEFLQDDATPDNLAEALLTLLKDRGARERLESRFEQIRATLRQNTEEKAAAAIMPLLARARTSERVPG
jgi:lipid-A-disaccharide synthase